MDTEPYPVTYLVKVGVLIMIRNVVRVSARSGARVSKSKVVYTVTQELSITSAYASHMLCVSYP